MALDFYAGSLGGCAGVLVGYPLDTVKVRLQTQDPSKKIYRGTIHCISTIIKKESVRGLYKGMSSPMWGLAAVNAVVYGTNGNILRATTSPHSLDTQIFAGSVAGFVQSFITSPMELAKTRMQLQGQLNHNSNKNRYWYRPKVLYRNPLDCLRKSFRQEGMRGIFRGLGCTILRDSPGFAIFFSCNQFLIDTFKDTHGNVSFLALLISGGLAGVTSWILTYPIDVIKSRIQADGMEGSKKYNGLWDCVKKSYQSEGGKVFARGLNSTIIRAFPTNAVTSSVVYGVFVLYNTKLNAQLGAEHYTHDFMEKELQRISICLDTCM